MGPGAAAAARPHLQVLEPLGVHAELAGVGVDGEEVDVADALLLLLLNVLGLRLDARAVAVDLRACTCAAASGNRANHGFLSHRPLARQACSEPRLDLQCWQCPDASSVLEEGQNSAWRQTPYHVT
jgi:hypothetical protein